MDEQKLEHIESVWETLARNDPLWAILSMPEKKGRKWDLEEFFEEGRAEVDLVMQRVAALGYPLRHGSALDFGCGVGRLSQPLGEYFDHVNGVDISATMIELARKFNRHGESVEYIHNTVNNLSIFADRSFDFIYSNIVLQHMDACYAIAYLNEFLRVTRPEGFIVFQIPSHFTDEYLPFDATDEPIAPTLCRAKLLAVSAPKIVEPGQKFEASVEVTNLSNATWLQGRTRQLNLGNHWRSKDGTAIVVHDDGRVRLPGRLRSGERVTMRLPVRAPAATGEYQLEIDVVQEGVRWFQEAGSETVLIPVQVSHTNTVAMTDHGGAAADPDVELPHFLMNGVPKQQILDMMSTAGATVLRIEEHITEWYSYKYFVRR